MSDPLVTVQHVTKTFEHEGRPLEVLKGIDLEIERGEMVTIVLTPRHYDEVERSGSLLVSVVER